MKTKKTLWIVGILLVIIIVILAVAKSKGMIGKENAIKVSIEQAEKRTIIETVAANGKIQPEIDVKITPYISGEVVELFVKEGEAVNKGDLLARIDPELYESAFERTEAALNSQQANLANARAGLAQMEAQFIKAKNDFKRSQSLFDQGVISESEFDGSKSVYSVSEAQVNAAKQSVKAAQFNVESSRASLRESKENLTRTAIYAPTSGTVSKLNVEKGERVMGASQFSAGTEIMVIANLELMEVNVEVNENDIVRVDLADTCIIEVDAYLKDKFKGVVTEIATSANTLGVSAEQVTNFDVKIRILPDSYSELQSKLNGRSPFRPGMSATVDIQTESMINVITIPIQAVSTRSDTTGVSDLKQKESSDRIEQNEDREETKESDEQEEFYEVVFLLKDGEAKLQIVETGIQDSKYIQIISGISESDEIITGPYRTVSKTLKNGTKVRVVEKEKLFDKE
ncbi:MAG: efflux RND transporter periplasmic adaptor subunit [Bacteroidales bacterium]|nr:efflux RND transporter periplasmic adaptor subunit [Bacteroidales bacterium]